MTTRHVTNLRGLRRALGKSQAQVAHELGVNKATYNTWETGKVQLKAKAILDISHYFGCTPNEVLAFRGTSHFVAASDDEVKVIELYRRMPPNIRHAIVDIMTAFPHR